MGVCVRLARQITDTFPTVTLGKVLKDIEGYRNHRDYQGYGLDLEGKSEYFKRVLNIAVQTRHSPIGEKLSKLVKQGELCA